MTQVLRVVSGSLEGPENHGGYEAFVLPAPYGVEELLYTLQHGHDPDTARALQDAQEALRQHPWPGNVRELRNAIERAMILGPGPRLTRRDFAFSLAGMEPGVGTQTPFRLPEGGLDMEALERDLVRQALERSGGNQKQAAELLGMTRDQIRYRLEKYGGAP